MARKRKTSELEERLSSSKKTIQTVEPVLTGSTKGGEEMKETKKSTLSRVNTAKASSTELRVEDIRIDLGKAKNLRAELKPGMENSYFPINLKGVRTTIHAEEFKALVRQEVLKRYLNELERKKFESQKSGDDFFQPPHKTILSDTTLRLFCVSEVTEQNREDYLLAEANRLNNDKKSD